MAGKSIVSERGKAQNFNSFLNGNNLDDILREKGELEAAVKIQKLC